MSYLRRLVILLGLAVPTPEESVELGWTQEPSALSAEAQINIATEEALKASFDLIRLQKEIYDDIVSGIAALGLHVEVKEEYRTELSQTVKRIRASIQVAQEAFGISEEELMP